MAISMREVAKLAGVSSATVSRVINGSSLVTEETAIEVRRVIQNLNFVPNNSALYLKQGKSQIYGAIIPDLTNPFFMELVKILEEVLVENERELLVANTDFHPSRLQRSIHRMLLRRVDGVVFLSSELESASLESLVQNRIPVVTTDHYRTGPGISDILVDFPGGMAQIVRHLKELGHTQIGFIGGSEGLVTSRVRRESFLDAIVKNGLSSREGWIVSGNFKIAGGEAGMAAILSGTERPTAVATANDLTAIGALRAARDKGLRVPEDISVAGCDDIEMADIVNPPLTTLRISRKQYAQMLFEALRLGEDDLSRPGQVYRLPMKMIVRQSTGPVPRVEFEKKNGKSALSATRKSS
jgi:DNA-binding LacI/PurR family transcriptional regulator